MTAHDLVTARLHLVPLSAHQLRLCRDNTWQLEQQMSLTISRAMLRDPVPQAISTKLQNMQRNSETAFLWYTYWLMVVTAVAHAPGLIGFKGAPDKQGRVEIGYGIDQQYRNKGHTTEAAEALIVWAFKQPGCKAVTAWVENTNPASSRLLQKIGMHPQKSTAHKVKWGITKVSEETPVSST